MMIAGILFMLLVVCASYLTADWIIDEIKRERQNKKELEDWNSLRDDDQYSK